MCKFWNFMNNELRLDGVIAEESWFGDEVTPKAFKDELMAQNGDLTVVINSPGGDVFAASRIYNMLMEYPHKVTVKIDSLAASAASVIAMAGSQTLMSPTSMLMIHNPSTMAWGDSSEMQRAKAMLDEVKESIINAYELKTSLSRREISKMMDDETWLSAKKAKKLCFIDDILYTGDESNDGVMFARTDCYKIEQAVAKAIINKLKPKPKGRKISDCYSRLKLLQGGSL